MIDIIVANGLIVDGTGKPSCKMDLAIKDGKIIKIGENIKDSATKIIDAEGLVISPGFIDVHSHNDLVPFMEEEIQDLKLKQGVTTELVGQCGLGVIPCIEDESKLWKNYIKGVVGNPDIKFDFEDVEDYINKITKKGLKNNYSVLISHGAIRSSVMDFESRESTDKEIDEMCRLVNKAMEQGAIGMSLGLQYIPGIFAKKKELISLCKVVKAHNGIIMVHVRNHDRNIINAMKEIIDVAEESKVKLHISHMRSYDSKILGCSAEVLINLVEESIKKGINITFDEHLYLSGSTLMTQLLPPWLTDKGTDVLLKMLKDEEVLNRVKKELKDMSINYLGWDNYSSIAGWDGILITSLSKENNLKYIGKTVGEISKDLNIDPVNFIAKLLIEEETGVGIVTLNIFSEDDTIKLIKHPLQMVGSDSIPAGEPHPRLYGNYPLFIGKFVREKKAITLEDAIYKCTLLPARTLGLTDIGQIQEGKKADITIFDFNEITGYEDYNNKRKAPIGIKHIIVNGNVAMENGMISKEKYGDVLKVK
ncbi:D-aminoacylase [Clostridium sp.]|uniref:N-acyl-D-amino-acid deacylase family protein n=1 Tax=Clostridium sp. TaxID=1506 RepID=UPI00261D96ED|nr:D-aminoacylase [Clostridium sp.]